MKEGVDICLESEEMLSPNLWFTKHIEHTETHTHRQNYTPSPALFLAERESDYHNGCGTRDACTDTEFARSQKRTGLDLHSPSPASHFSPSSCICNVPTESRPLLFPCFVFRLPLNWRSEAQHQHTDLQKYQVSFFSINLAF